MSEPGAVGRRGPGVGLVLAAAGSAILVVALAVVAILVLRDPVGGGAPGVETVAGGGTVTNTESSSTPTAVPTTAPTTAPTTEGVAGAPPGVLEQCSDSGESVLPRSGRGTEVTSCPFADAVRDAYFRTARPGDPALVEAHSPATGQRYEMGCIENHNNGGIICRGGDNAVVYVY